jgi:hypothetical protein
MDNKSGLSGLNALGWTLAIVVGLLVGVPVIFCCVAGPLAGIVGAVTK